MVPFRPVFGIAQATLKRKDYPPEGVERNGCPLVYCPYFQLQEPM